MSKFLQVFRYARYICPLTAALLSLILLGGSGTNGMPHLYLLKIDYGKFNEIRTASGHDRTAHRLTLVGVCGIVYAELENGHIRTVGNTMRILFPYSNLIFDQLSRLKDHGASVRIDWAGIYQYGSFKRCTAALFAFLLLTGLSSLLPMNGGTERDYSRRTNVCKMVIYALIWLLDALIAAALCTVNYRHASKFGDILGNTGVHITVGPVAVVFVWVCVGCVIFHLASTVMIISLGRKTAQAHENNIEQITLSNEQDEQARKLSQESGESNWDIERESQASTDINSIGPLDTAKK